MSTASEREVISRGDCIEEAAEALARCYADLGTTTAPAVETAEAV